MNKQTEAPWPPEDEILQHYGYAPADVHRNGVGVGYWKREEALARFAEQPEELKYLSDKRKSGSSLNTTRISRWRCIFVTPRSSVMRVSCPS